MNLPNLKLKIKAVSREFVLLAALVFVCMMWFRSCEQNHALEASAKRDILIAQQNQRALSDSVRHYRNKAGEIEAVKSSFVTELNKLKDLNTDLHGELRKEIGNVRSLIKAQADVDRGKLTVSNDLIRYPDNITYGLRFKDAYTDSSLTWTLNGESKFKLENNTLYPGTTTITENRIRVGLVMGFKENKDNYEVFARSSSPLVTFNELDGVILIPKKNDITCPPPAKKKRFGLGPSIGYGLSQDLRLTPFVGLSLNWNLIEF